jgi:hypothetical protein
MGGDNINAHYIMEKPFSREYVLQTTARYMLKSINLSIKKTMDRMIEFKDDHAKSNEVFITLAELQGLKNQIEPMCSNTTK